jgi:hypothetical protein
MESHHSRMHGTVQRAKQMRNCSEYMNCIWIRIEILKKQYFQVTCFYLPNAGQTKRQVSSPRFATHGLLPIDSKLLV